MNLDKVIPLPLENNEYVAAGMQLLLEDTKQTPVKTIKQLQNVCIVYACLAVKRNAGIVGSDAKLAAAAQGYREIAVPGFFRWARDHGYTLPSWLTFDHMGRTTRRVRTSTDAEQCVRHRIGDHCCVHPFQ